VQSPASKNSSNSYLDSFASAYNNLAKREEETESRFSQQLDRLDKKQDALLNRVNHNRFKSSDFDNQIVSNNQYEEKKAFEQKFYQYFNYLSLTIN
jgi:hypothetical protein